MRLLNSVFIAAVLIASVGSCGAQNASGGPPPPATPAPTAPNTPNASATFNPAAPSGILHRSLDEVNQTLGAVRLEKWKRGSVRDAAGTNIDAIQRDMKNTLPSLLKEADAAPATLSKTLPLSRNVDALYDVLVHLVEQSRVSGTSEDAGQLQQVLADLEKARVVLDNQILQTASAQEKQIVDLRTTVQRQDASLRAAATPPPAPKCPAPPAPAKKKHVVKKPSTTANPSANSNGSTTANPPKPQQ